MQLGSYKCRGDTLNDLYYSPDGTVLATCSHDAHVDLFDSTRDYKKVTDGRISSLTRR